ncbi:MAG: preprotein translocase subunit SecB [Firmicutes bacterium]|jgi:preprotein translocase subunit SecB|nr:preprotein translocase subunit SecB [Bacillota bacterium]
MKDKDVSSDFIFIGNRVKNFNLETRQVNKKDQQAVLSFDFEYNVNDVQRSEEKLLGIIEFMVKARAKIKRRILFKVELVMEGAFGCESKHLSEERFMEMLEINGLITLSHLSRAYLINVTSQSGFTPPLKMPMINVMKLREMKKQSTE